MFLYVQLLEIYLNKKLKMKSKEILKLEERL